MGQPEDCDAMPHAQALSPTAARLQRPAATAFSKPAKSVTVPNSPTAMHRAPAKSVPVQKAMCYALPTANH